MFDGHGDGRELMKSAMLVEIVSRGDCTGGRRRDGAGGFCAALLSRLLTVVNATVWNGELVGSSAILDTGAESSVFGSLN